MKKTLILMAAASAFVLTGCTESDLSGDTSLAKESSSAIEFSAKTRDAGVTRAGQVGSMTNTSIKDPTAGFGVFAYYTGSDGITDWGGWNGTANPPVEMSGTGHYPNFMYNQKVTWSTSSPADQWNYEPVKYWPNGIDKANETNAPSNTATEANAQKLSFFAYAPYVYHGTDYETSNGFVGGDLPAGKVTAAVYTGDAVSPTAPTAKQKGVVAMSKNTNEQDMYVKYILDNATETGAVDLLWGLRGQKTYQETDNVNNTEATLGNVYNTDLTKQTVGEKVDFLFKHALSRVGGSTSSTTAGGTQQVCGLWAVVDVDKNSSVAGEGQSEQTTFFSTNFNKASTLVTIESVKIRDAYTYTQTEDEEDGNDDITNEESDFLTDGWFDIMNGTWTNTTTVKEHTTSGKGVTYSVTAQSDEPVADGDAVYALNTQIKENGTSIVKPTAINQWQSSNNTAAGYTGGAEGVELTKKKVFADEDVPGLLLIPGAGNNTLYITVKYHVRTADPNLKDGFSHVTQEITNKVTLDGSILKPNKYYNLVMHLGLTSVKFEAIVANWSNGDNEYNEDGSEEDPSTGENNTSVWLPSNVVAYVASYEVASDATSQNVDFSSFANVGNYVGETHSGTGVSSVAYSSPNVTITLTPNTTSSKVENTVTLKGQTGKVIVTITQNAAAITIGDLATGKVNISGPSDLDLSTATITVVDGDGTNYGYSASADETHYTYDNSSDPKTITIPTTAGKTYTITVTQNAATVSKDIVAP